MGATYQDLEALVEASLDDHMEFMDIAKEIRREMGCDLIYSVQTLQAILRGLKRGDACAMYERWKHVGQR